MLSAQLLDICPYCKHRHLDHVRVVRRDGKKIGVIIVKPYELVPAPRDRYGNQYALSYEYMPDQHGIPGMSNGVLSNLLREIEKYMKGREIE